LKRRKKTAHSSFEMIQDQLETIGADLTSLGNTLGEAASDEVRATIRSIQERLDRIASDAGNATRAGIGAIEDRIEASPITSVAVAFGLGALLASIMRR